MIPLRKKIPVGKSAAYQGYMKRFGNGQQNFLQAHPDIAA